MDYTKIPHFALFRQACTVIVRIRMEVDTCCRVACQTTDHPQYSLRPSCEQCSRSRSNSRYSDCDSELVEKCRRYRCSAARSRYVNVCAAVCLVLLVGGLLPQSAAAPHKRSMDSSEDKQSWENPCDYNSKYQPSKLNYTPNLADKVAKQAKSAYDSTAMYKDEFASKLHSYKQFDLLLGMWDTSEWLRKFSDGGLPKEKVLYQPMSDDYMNKLISTEEKIDQVLPSMYMALKMVVAGLHSVKKDLNRNTNIPLDDLVKNVTISAHQVQAVLCYFNDLMSSRGLEILPLSESEVQRYKEDDRFLYALLVYRDTLNYLEYLHQVFQKIYEVEKAQAQAIKVVH